MGNIGSKFRQGNVRSKKEVDKKILTLLLHKNVYIFTPNYNNLVSKKNSLLIN
jgi:hypothetical protein